jgi:hypothetical protein
MPNYTVKGYIKGDDALDKKYVRNPNNGEPAFFVPQKDLKTNFK